MLSNIRILRNYNDGDGSRAESQLRLPTQQSSSEEQFMRRVILLALLALALPTATLASTIAYVGQALTTNPATVTGSVASGGSLGVTFSSLSINGGAFSAGTVAISLTLGTTSCGTGCFNIASGTVDIWNGSSVSLFKGTFSTGSATKSGQNIYLSGVT